MALRVPRNPPVKLSAVAFPLPSLCFSILFYSSRVCPSLIVLFSLSISVPPCCRHPQAQFFNLLMLLYNSPALSLIPVFPWISFSASSVLPSSALSQRVSFKPPVKWSVFSVSFQLSALYLSPISVLSLVNLRLCHTLNFSSAHCIALRVRLRPSAKVYIRICCALNIFSPLLLFLAIISLH